MNNPKWSRRIAKVVNSKYFYSLPLEEQLKFRDLANKTSSFSDFFDWGKQIITKSEEKQPQINFHTILAPKKESE